MQEDVLNELRNLIDALDDEIIHKISKRHQISKMVGEFKQKHNMAVTDNTREQWLHEYHHQLSEKYNIPAEFVDELFELIIVQSKKLQKTILT